MHPLPTALAGLALALVPQRLPAEEGPAPPEPYTADELDELGQLEETVALFERSAAEFRAETRRIIEHKYKARRDYVHNAYEQLIVALEREQASRRASAIAKFEQFIARYPDHPQYTPDAMFRLAELQFERSFEDFRVAQDAHERALAAWSPDSGAPEPEEPSPHYEPTIATMQQLITRFPEYRLVDGAYYLLGYCLGEQSEEERAIDVYRELVARRPNSRFAPEVWTRIGEYYFDVNELERALAAYTEVLAHYDSPLYDKALYKLAWTHYRLADPEAAPHEFQEAVDTFVELLELSEATKAQGRERGAELRKEAVQYIAIAYAEEGWGSTDKALAYLDKRPDRPYARDILVALGDVYFDQTRFREATRVYFLVQERYPMHVDAPKVQDKLITAYERERDFDGAAGARRMLAATYAEGTPWYGQHKDDAEAIRAANKLIEQSLYAAALFHHRQAQVHREAQRVDQAKEQYALAAKAYGDYLKRFPHDKQLYELKYYRAESLYYSLQFDDAAVEYEWVRDSTAGDQFRSDSAYSVILSYENAIRQRELNGTLAPAPIRKSSERLPGEKPTPRELPPLKTKLVAASDIFTRTVPGSEEAPKVLYKAAEIHYAYDHLVEARERFLAVLERYPKDEVAAFASNLIIESYLAEQDFRAVEAFARQLLERPDTFGTPEVRAELVKFKSGAMFKIADELVQKGEHEAAAELYLKMVDENPRNEFADSAINNAAVAYEKVSRFDSASRLYERLVRDYPDSPLADSALFRVGLNAERFFNFEKAITVYLDIIRRYPKSERRADAVYNAALALENTQDYERSAAQYLRYCDLFNTRDDAPAVCFRAGDVYEKMGDLERAVATYQAFIKRYRNNAAHADRVVEAHLRVAKIYDELGKEKNARELYERTVKLARQAGDKAVPYGAEAQFQLVERQFEAFKNLKIDGNTKQQQKALLKKAERLKQVEAAYQGILPYKQFDWTLASLFRIGQLYQSFAESLVSAPCPPDVKRAARRMGATAQEVCDVYRVELEDKSVNIEEKAVTAFETTINKAREFQVANDWTKQTLVALNKLRRNLWPLQKDARHYVDEVAIAGVPFLSVQGEPTPLPPVELPSADAAASQTPVPARPPAPPAAPPTPPPPSGSSEPPATS